MTYEEIESLLYNVKYKDWKIVVRPDNERLYMQVVFLDECHKTGEELVQKGRKWLLSPWMTKSEIVQTAFKACLTAEEHECREKFKYYNAEIFGPHYDVDALREIVNRQDKRK